MKFGSFSVLLAIVAGAAVPGTAQTSEMAIPGDLVYGLALVSNDVAIVVPTDAGLPQFFSLSERGGWRRRHRFSEALGRGGSVATDERLTVDVAASGSRLVSGWSLYRRDATRFDKRAIPSLFGGQLRSRPRTLDRCRLQAGTLRASGRAIAYIGICDAEESLVRVHDIGSGRRLASVASPAGEYILDVGFAGRYLELLSCRNLQFQDACPEPSIHVFDWRSGREAYSVEEGILDAPTSLDGEGRLLATRCSPGRTRCTYWLFAPATPQGTDTGVSGTGEVFLQGDLALMEIAGHSERWSDGGVRLALFDLATGRLRPLTTTVETWNGREAMNSSRLALAGGRCGGGTKIVLKRLRVWFRDRPERFC